MTGENAKKNVVDKSEFLHALVTWLLLVLSPSYFDFQYYYCP